MTEPCLLSDVLCLDSTLPACSTTLSAYGCPNLARAYALSSSTPGAPSALAVPEWPSCMAANIGLACNASTLGGRLEFERRKGLGGQRIQG